MPPNSLKLPNIQILNRPFIDLFGVFRLPNYIRSLRSILQFGQALPTRTHAHLVQNLFQSTLIKLGTPTHS